MIKPKILGKLICYNKVYRIETGFPLNNGKKYHTYFTSRLQEWKKEYDEHLHSLSILRKKSNSLIKSQVNSRNAISLR
ncbi:hypothetical protein B0A75_18475 [Flavobacterium oncorhynchi]|uniref:Uncharacterized protein n=1 Tax=Flavobacterium oncorhynchi TaxID=728056 RepID=A0A226HNT8_9FLAO|nr:hypothetical protein B0A75_18475 [Flavobacterium oncorhynchi]